MTSSLAFRRLTCLRLSDFCPYFWYAPPDISAERLRAARRSGRTQRDPAAATWRESEYTSEMEDGVRVSTLD